MLKRLYFILFSLFCFVAAAQTVLRYEQLAPKGLPYYPTDIHVFPDQSAIINVNGPYIYRFPLFNDSTLQNFGYNLIFTDSLVTGARMEVLSNRIFTKGEYITRDGGVNWTLIKSQDFLNFWFLKPDFWIFHNIQGQIFTSRDSGTTWQSDNVPYKYALGDEDYRTLIRESDSTVFHLYQDTLIPRVKWTQRYPGKNLPLYYHQVDSLRYLFEVDLQLYRYELDLDTTFEVNDISTLNRPFINIYTPGDQFIREDNLSYVFLFADTTMQWINRSKVYNAGSFEYSDGRMWYNSYKPFHPFSLGNIAFFRPLNNQKVIWGDSEGFIPQIANTSIDSIFYTEKNYLDSKGLATGTPHNNSFNPFNQMEYGLGIAFENYSFYETTDDGLSWQEHVSNASGIPIEFSLRDYNRAADTSCFIELYLRYLDPRVEAKIILNDGTNSLLQSINSNGNNGEYLKFPNGIGFKDCDTGSVLIDNRLYRTNDGGANFDSPFTGTKFYNFKRIDSSFYLSSDSGMYTSNNYYDWQLFGGPLFNKRLDYIFNDSIFFNLGSEGTITYSLDGGNSISTLNLQSLSLNDAAGIGDSALFVTSNGGALFKIYLPWATVPIALEEESIQLPKISIFPNPNRTGFITIDASVDFNNYKVYNINGQEIARGQMRENQKKLQIIKPQTGIYYLELNTNKGFQYRTKIVFE
tara:strand:+ start:1148 stop:3220 length:2073 start_codon:yes stop_codon:yes gene_type:complete